MLRFFHNFFCFAGLALSIYTTYVEYKVHENPEYKAACDIKNDLMEASCTKAFTSDYGKGMFGMIKDTSSSEPEAKIADKNLVDQVWFYVANCPNSILGIFFYSLIYFLGRHWDCPKAAKLNLFLSITSLAPTFWLAYVLMYILHDVCVVCISTYICNFGLIFTNWRRNVMINGKKDEKKQQ